MTERGERADGLPFVSVVIPVKNGEGKLEHCLQALRRQTYPAELFEIVVADGSSTDRTALIARDAGARVVDNPRQNAAAGRNVGIAATRGGFVAILDDDCIPASDWLARGVAELQARGYDALGGPLTLPGESTAWARAVDWVFMAAARGAGAVQSGRAGKSSAVEDIPGGNALYRRRALELVGPYDETLWAEDVDLHLRMRQLGLTLGFCAQFVATHRRRDSVPGFFQQMRRYGIGRVQVLRKHGRGMKPTHLAVAGLGVLTGLAAVGLPGPALVVGVGTGLLLFTVGLTSGAPPKTALLVGPAFAVFMAGWTVGTLGEMLFPLRTTTGW